jgi:flavin-dependent dehydrogenase
MAKSIVIVGGGTSGWMTASYLKKAAPGLDVTLIESPSIKTIGVGEATFSTLKLFFDYLGLQEHDWMPSCNGTYKMAIKFSNWRQDGGHFYHPFQRYETVDGYNMGEWWLKLKRNEEAFDQACFSIPALCERQRSPRFLDGRVFDDKVQDYYGDAEMAKNTVLADHKVQYPYAYHFDASLLADFLMNYATQRGVRRVVDEVIEVQQKEDGSISHVVSRNHGDLHGDLFVDCTGFRGLLINQTLKEPFISFSDSLLNDRAIALQVPRDVHTYGIDPYTSATALSAGWVWNIPLYGRVGTGYVYSSQFLSPEEAEAEFRAYLGPDANHIKMRIGRNRNSWVKNCIAVGLSSGFVEPLESTGIFFIQHGIEELVNHLPGDTISEEMVKSYNKAVADAIDGVRDFLILHYCTTDRNDNAFWRATKEVKMSAELTERLELWKKRLPNGKNINQNFHGFEFYSYSVMLMGLGYHPETSLPALDHLDDRNALRAFRALREKTQRLSLTLPSQYEYLTHMREQAGAPIEELYRRVSR